MSCVVLSFYDHDWESKRIGVCCYDQFNTSLGEINNGIDEYLITAPRTAGRDTQLVVEKVTDTEFSFTLKSHLNPPDRSNTSRALNRLFNLSFDIFYRPYPDSV